MNQNKIMQRNYHNKGKQIKGNGQGMLEFALALPILLMLIFGIIDFALTFQAWLQIENMVRQTTRFAVTGQYDEKYCTTDNGWNWSSDSDGSAICEGEADLEEQERARLLSILEMANSQKVALFEETGVNQNDVGYINIVVCSNRDVNSNGDKTDDYQFIQPDMGATYSDCDDSGTTRVDAGAPGDQVYIAVDLNHPFITPLLNKVWPMAHLASHREGRVETFRISKLDAFPSVPEIPDTLTPSPTLSPTPTNTLMPTATLSPTPTLNPYCSGISFSTDWSINKKDVKIKVENVSGAAVHVSQAVFVWDNYDAYNLAASVTELKFDKTKIFEGEDPDSITDSGGGWMVTLANGAAKDFKAKFNSDVTAGAVSTTDFGLALHFDNGCVLYKPVTSILNTPTPGATANPFEVPVGGEGEIWYVGTDDPDVYLKVTWDTNSDGSVTVLAEFSKNFNDNSYGQNAQTDWPRKLAKCEDKDKDGDCDLAGCVDGDGDGECDDLYECKDKDGDGECDGAHTFRELWHSDHLVFDMIGVGADGSQSTFFNAKMDLLVEDATAPSGWATGGVTNGDAEVYEGNAGMVQSIDTSMDHNLNDLGCTNNLSHSPTVDENYNQVQDEYACAGWDFNVWFEITIDQSAIPPGGFAYPAVTSIHASPSKRKLDTQAVSPGASPTPTLTPSNTPSITPTASNTSTPFPTFTPYPTFTPGGPTSTFTAGPETATPTYIYWDP